MRAAIVSVSLLVCAAAFADDLVAARDAFIEGTELVKQSQWADALVAFEKSARLHPHATTTFNIGGCQRVLGRSTLARATLERALAESAQRGKELPQELASDAEAFIGEIDRLLVHVAVELVPREADITVDGRPLAVQSPSTLVAGILPPGRGAPPPGGSFELILDPGAHVFVLSRRGYGDAVVQRSWPPGTRARLDLEMARLPATLHVTASEAGALVTVDDADVGPAPVEVLRPAGEHRIIVRKKGFAPYRARVTVAPGEQAELQAALAVEKVPIYKRWWFWTGAAVLAGGIFGLSYGLARQASPPDYQRGSTGWLVEPK